MAFTSPPPPTPTILLSFPTPQILLATINRPTHLNSLPTSSHWELHSLWTWYDTEPSLRCAIITGAPGGKQRSFCAGQDLKEWHASTSTPTPTGPSHPPSGFAGLSQRTGKKPVIAAISGLCLGGGFEIVLNTDMAVCTPQSTFGLPEAYVGVAAFAGALPRLTHVVGLARASELAYTGRRLTAEEAERWGLVNGVVEDAVEGAVDLARRVCRASPDSVVVSRAGLRSAWSGVEVGEAVKSVWEGLGEGLRGGENMKEGLRSFVERREPRWVDSKL